MSLSFSILVSFIAAAFAFYGYNCFRNTKIVAEFDRFGLSPRQRVLTGVFQLLGAAGLLLGLLIPEIGLLAAAGLCILMMLGFGVRLKIKDSFLQAMPSFGLMLLNAYLTFQFAHHLEFI